MVMVSSSSSIIFWSLLFSCVAFAQQQVPLWGQCGGQSWQGSTTCVSGACCEVINDYYSQCVPGDCGTPTTTTSSSSTTISPTTTTTDGPQPTGGIGTPGCGKTPPTSGTYNISINGITRSYILRIPDNYDPTHHYRLIFGFHWFGGTMTDVDTGSNVETDTWAYYGLKRISNQTNNPTIFVAPQGIDNGWPNTDGMDIAFVDGMVQILKDSLCVDVDLVFATGFSYGAGMSYSIACTRADVFRGVAGIAGAELSGCAGGGSIPIAYLGIHGIRDDVLPIELGRTIRDTFVATNGCDGSQNPAEPMEGSLTHVKTTYEGCRDGYPVVWIAFDSGHNAAPIDGSAVDSSGATWASEETWLFFSQFS